MKHTNKLGEGPLFILDISAPELTLEELDKIQKEFAVLSRRFFPDKEIQCRWFFTSFPHVTLVIVGD